MFHKLQLAKGKTSIKLDHKTALQRQEDYDVRVWPPQWIYREKNYW